MSANAYKIFNLLDDQMENIKDENRPKKDKEKYIDLLLNDDQ
ncbi:16707_t:CDS:2 [Cetraspora pellucida]|uniref:16707_t:CDS:1 n=1 Tax=Cetraspora pellucida TaxID=1433469 RepID=A0A9N8VI36_9GLOM|nr:16707_t:CDS:2 [Cetraspora pellucida]